MIRISVRRNKKKFWEKLVREVFRLPRNKQRTKRKMNGVEEEEKKELATLTSHYFLLPPVFGKPEKVLHSGGGVFVLGFSFFFFFSCSCFFFFFSLSCKVLESLWRDVHRKLGHPLLFCSRLPSNRTRRQKSRCCTDEKGGLWPGTQTEEINWMRPEASTPESMLWIQREPKISSPLLL